MDLTVKVTVTLKVTVTKVASLEWWRQRSAWTGFKEEGRRGIRDANIGNSFKEFCYYRAKREGFFMPIC